MESHLRELTALSRLYGGDPDFVLAGGGNTSFKTADFLYVKVTPGDSEASVTDWRLGADYYFLRNAGLGVQYKYNKYSYDRGILVSQLGGEITYKGFQVFLTFLF